MTTIANIKKAFKNKKEDPLFCCLVGPSGSGKSYLIGTLSLPTAYLYLSSEAHGPKAASSTNDNILPICLDMKEEFDNFEDVANIPVGSPLSPEKTLAKYNHYVNLPWADEGVKALALDGLTDMELVIKNTLAFKAACTNANGKYNKFAESDELIKFIWNLNKPLMAQHRNGLHVLVTIAGVVQTLGENGAAETIQPKLSTFGVADQIPRLFGDILLLSRARIEGETKHVIVFDGNMERKGKDAAGNVTKISNFAPRLLGVDTNNLPPMCKADLKKVLEIRSAVKESA